MTTYIDEYRSRFGIGPICRILAESLDCGFITPRGYRMFKSRPPSQMRARHEALARDILVIHSDFFMAVHGYRKMRAQLIAQGWDPKEVGRDQVLNVMRELGVQGVRRGKSPPPPNRRKARVAGQTSWTGSSRRRRRTACTWPTPPTCAWRTGASATRLSPPTCTPGGSWAGRAPPPWTRGSCLCRRWSRRYRGPGTDGLVHHSGHGAQYISLVYTARVMEYGMLPSTGTVGDSYDNAMAESADGATRPNWFGSESHSPIWPSWSLRRSGGPRGGDSKRLHQSLDYRTPEAVGTEYYANQAAQAASL